VLAPVSQRREGGIEEGQRLAEIAYTEREVIEHGVTWDLKRARRLEAPRGLGNDAGATYI
jgi:hypothetical protein